MLALYFVNQSFAKEALHPIRGSANTRSISAMTMFASLWAKPPTLFLCMLIDVNAASTCSSASDLTLNMGPPSIVPLLKFDQDFRT